jgi:hypothetical protein
VYREFKTKFQYYGGIQRKHRLTLWTSIGVNSFCYNENRVFPPPVCLKLCLGALLEQCQNKQSRWLIYPQKPGPGSGTGVLKTLRRGCNAVWDLAR